MGVVKERSHVKHRACENSRQKQRCLSGLSIKTKKQATATVTARRTRIDSQQTTRLTRSDFRQGHKTRSVKTDGGKKSKQRFSKKSQKKRKKKNSMTVTFPTRRSCCTPNRASPTKNNIPSTRGRDTPRHTATQITTPASVRRTFTAVPKPSAVPLARDTRRPSGGRWDAPAPQRRAPAARRQETADRQASTAQTGTQTTQAPR